MTSKSIAHAGAAETFAAGAQGAPEFVSIADRQAAEMAKLRRERDEAREELARASVRGMSTELGLAVGMSDAVQLARVGNLAESERARAMRAGEPFDVRLAVAQAIHDVKIAKGEPSVAPVAPNGASRAAKPASFLDVQAERARYRARLAELGLADPEFGSTAGDGSLSFGGPIAPK
jgi:hypothetical protein